MTTGRIRRLVAVPVIGVLLATLFMSCGSLTPSPTAPSSPTSAYSPSVATVGFGQLTTVRAMDLATCLQAPSAACLSFVPARQSLRVGAQALSAPISLSSSVAGTTVTLTWTAPAGSVSAYVIEAGSSGGLSNLASFSTGNALTSFSTTGVPAGTYFVRVRAVDSTATVGPASNEVVVVVVGGGCLVPGAPTGFTTSRNSGGTVSFGWTAASGSPTSYILEAGSAPGLSDLASADVGGATTFTATGVVAGTYYVRVRGRNACGIGPVSIEVTVVVSLSIAPGRSSFTATIDGVPWSALPSTILTTRSNVPNLPSGLLGVTGIDRFQCPSLTLALGFPRAVGTYAIGPVPLGSQLNISDAALSTANCNGGQWTAGAFEGSGSITVSTVTSTGATGTFFLTLVAQRGSRASGTRTVTDGVFNVTF